MRRMLVAGMAAGRLITGSGGTAVAQGDAGTSLQPIEVPEAGIGLAFPATWAVDIQMRQREDYWLSELYPDAAPVIFWNVLYASEGGDPWCDLNWYPDHPMSLAEYAQTYETLITPDSGVERTIEVRPVQLAVGDAYRFDIYNQPTDQYSTVYLFRPDPSLYLLQCVGSSPDEAAWLKVAETIELPAAAETPAATELPAATP